MTAADTDAPPTPVFGAAPHGKGEPGKGGGIQAWVKTHRTEALAGAGGSVAVLALIARSRAKSSSADTSTAGDGGAVSTGGTSGGSDPSSGYSSSSVDQYNALASAISQLGDQDDSLSSEVAKLQQQLHKVRLHKPPVHAGKPGKYRVPGKKGGGLGIRKKPTHKHKVGK